jgi:hypothetical protein
MFVAQVRGHDAVEERRELTAILHAPRTRRHRRRRTEDLLLLTLRTWNERPDRRRLRGGGRGDREKDDEQAVGSHG